MLENDLYSGRINALGDGVNHPEARSDQKESNMTHSKTCTICRQTKSLKDFGYNNLQKNWQKTQCKDCDKKRMAIYYEKNRKAISANKQEYYALNRDLKLLQSRIYRKNNAERVKSSYIIWRDKNLESVRLRAKNAKGKRKAAQSAVVTIRDIRKILSKPCIYCGSLKSLQIEHVIPIARGGSHSIGNLASACAKCNSSKNKWFVMEWKLKLKKWGLSF